MTRRGEGDEEGEGDEGEDEDAEEEGDDEDDESDEDDDDKAPLTTRHLRQLISDVVVQTMKTKWYGIGKRQKG